MHWPRRLVRRRRRSSTLTQRPVRNLQELQLPPLTLAPHRITEFFGRLKQGITVIKHGRRGKPKSKILTLDRDEHSLSYYPSRKDECAIHFRDIRAIVLGHTTKVFQRHATPDQEQFAMSFVLQDGRTLDLELDSVLTLKLFSECMVYAVLNLSDMARESVHLQGELQKVRLIQMWCEMGKAQDRNIAFGEVPGLLRRLGLDVNPVLLEALLRKHDRDRSGDMQFEEFQTFVLELTDRPELKAIFQQYETEHGHLRPAEFRKFMVEVQKQPWWTEEDSRRLFKTLSGSAEQLSLERFVWWLGDHDDNNCISPARLNKPSQEMTRPLQDYYIATSHNTCLIGNQLDSAASVGLVKEALLAGCRCLDFDCCDGPDGDPIVTRAHTRCGSVLFQDVVSCIREWAFVKSTAPVILCLALHASQPQQGKVADILRTGLGSYLLVPEAGSMLPGRTWFGAGGRGFSPEALANKVLVKCRLPPNCYRPGECTKDERDLGGMPEEVVAAAALAEAAELHAGLAALVSLKAVANPLASRRRTGKGPVPEVVAFTGEEIAALPADEVRGLAGRALVFVYPAGRWMESENGDPQGPWLRGCQLMAMNWQTHDSFLRMYQAFFLRNGRCGYVLKPPLPDQGSSTSSHEPVSLVLHVLAGQQLVYCPPGRRGADAIDPFVQIRVSGHPKDAVPGLVFGQPPETRVVPGNALNPQFNGTFRLRIHCPALAVLSLFVYHHDPPRHAIVAEAHLPVDLLAQGYRRVPLCDPKDSRPIPCSSLFCRFELQQPKATPAATVRRPAVAQ
eukprot:EG_transcript_2948